jgi:hypothetical protein
VAVQWLSSAGLRPSDIRSRSFCLHLCNQTDSTHHDKVVWRLEYQCDGACKLTGGDGTVRSFHDPPNEIETFVRKQQREQYIRSKVLGDEADEANQDDEDGAEEDELDDDRQVVKGGKPCPAKLLVSMSRSQIETWLMYKVTITIGQIASNTCTITYVKPKFHAGCKLLHRLRPSPLLRDEIHRAALGMGMTAGRLRSCKYHSPGRSGHRLTLQGLSITSSTSTSMPSSFRISVPTVSL